MVRADLVAEKLQELDHRIARVRASCPATADELRTDENALDLVAFNLMLAVQICTDVASDFIADEGWRTAVTLAAAFERLAEHQVISAGTADALSNAARFRNVVAHGYAGFEVQKAFVAATEGVSDLEGFATEVATWMERRECVMKPQ